MLETEKAQKFGVYMCVYAYVSQGCTGEGAQAQTAKTIYIYKGGSALPKKHQYTTN